MFKLVGAPFTNTSSERNYQWKYGRLSRLQQELSTFFVATGLIAETLLIVFCFKCCEMAEHNS